MGDSDTSGGDGSLCDGSASETESRRDGSNRAALRRLQATLTGAMEHLEGAQLQFFHVQRALSARRRRRRPRPATDDVSEPSWSLRVRLYADFWSQFEAQLRAALAPSDATDRVLAALAVLARNVWGETCAPPASAFGDGPLTLVPAEDSASPSCIGAMIAAPATLNVLAEATGSERKKPKTKQAAVAAASADSKSLAKPASKRKPLGPPASRTLAVREAAPEGEGQRRKKQASNASPHESNGGRNGGSDMGQAAVASGELSVAKKRKAGADQAALASLIPPAPEAAASDHDTAENGASPPVAVHGSRSQQREEVLAHVRQRLQEQLAADEVWPALALPFPKHLLAFDAAKHAALAAAHERFWAQNIAGFLDIVYAHPTQAARARLHQAKMRLLRRQRALLSAYIEALGVAAVARLLLAPDARGAFFLVKQYIALEQLTPAQLEQHLAHVHSPWTSPVTRVRQIPWWEVFTRKGATKQVLVDASPHVQHLIARAHVQGDLAFDPVWTRLATQAPWKQMLDAHGSAFAAPDGDDASSGDVPQSPPARKKSAAAGAGAAAAGGGRVVIKEEVVGGAPIYSSYSPQRGLLEQSERIVMQFSSGDSSSSDESEFEDGTRPRATLGKRLRTSASRE